MHDMYVMGDLNTSSSAVVNVSLKDANGGTLFDAGPQDIASNSPTLVDFGGTTAPFIRVEIDWNNLGSYSYGDFTSDNIRFSQVVPEPCSLVLVGLGAAMLLIIRRRKR